MVDNAQGRKKSNFPGQTTVLSGGYFDYFVSGVNYKLAFSDLLTALGATGTMQQEGNALGTPILDVQGSINGIRNLEAGSGIKTSVSAENGATIEHNFALDTIGVALSNSFTVDQPIFRSITAGSGINVSGSADQIQISLSATPASTKTVIVNQLSDFPAAVAGVITLNDDTEYAIRNDVSTTNRFVLGNNCVLSGSDSITVALTYTGVGVMLTSVSRTWTLKNITINCTAGTFLDFNGTGVEVMQVKNSVINANILGTIDNIQGLQFDDTQFNVTTNGLLFGGVNGVVLVESTLGTIDAGTMIDLGTATFASFSVTENFTTLNGASVFMDGLASSANIVVGGLGTVHNSRFFGTGTPLQTITTFDLRWEFFLNDTIEDTHQDCLVSLTNNAVATVTPLNTPTLIAGVWVPEHESQFTGDANGRCTYNGTKDIHVDVSISMSSAPVSGSNKTIGHYVAKNGTEISNSEGKTTISAGDLSRTTVLWRIIMTTGDYIEAFVENETDSVNVLVTDAVLRIS